MNNQEIRDTLLEMSKDERDWKRQEALLAAAGLVGNTLMAFLRDEVPFRLTEILGVEYPLEPEIEADCRNILFNESDQIFNYDKMDELLEKVLDEYRVPQYGFSAPDMTITEFVEDELTTVSESWVDVKSQLPFPEKEVELFCQTKFGTYTCHGFYIPDNFSEEDSDFVWDFECMDSYDEENDCYYIAPGWYERIHNWDDYGAVGINDKVTHWRPLSNPSFKEDE